MRSRNGKSKPRTRLPLRERRQRLLHTIADLVQINGIAPTQRELAAAMGLSTTPVHQDIKHLTEEGYLTTRPGLARSLQLTEKAQSDYRLPVNQEG